MKPVLLSIDVFGETPSLLINQLTQYHSLFGQFMSVALYFISLASLIFFSLELFLKQSPSVNLSTQTNEHPSKIDYYGNFEFMIGIQNSSMLVHMDESIYVAKGFLFKTEQNSSGLFNNVIEIELEPCDKALVNSNLLEFLKMLIFKIITVLQEIKKMFKMKICL